MYSDEKRILEELAYADTLFRQLCIETIDVSKRSIESSMLIEIYQNKKAHKCFLFFFLQKSKFLNPNFPDKINKEIKKL